MLFHYYSQSEKRGGVMAARHKNFKGSSDYKVCEKHSSNERILPRQSVSPCHISSHIIWMVPQAHFFTEGNALSDPLNYDRACRPSAAFRRRDPPLLFDLDLDPGERYPIPPTDPR